MLLKRNKTYKYNFSKQDWKKRSLLHFGSLGLMALKTSFIDTIRLKSATFLISRFFKKSVLKKCKFWELLNFNFPRFKKSSHARMGKGKGKFLKFMAYIRRGQVIFEFGNLSKSLLRSLFLLLKKKLGLKLKLITRI